MSKPEIADPIYANKANLAATVLSSGVSSGATSISVVSASMLPTASFYATISPAGGMSDTQNSEIVLVTAISGNTLTVERAQRGTTAKSFEAGAVIFNGVYVHDVSYDASGLFDTKFNVYSDPSGLAQAIVDGRPLVVRDGGNTGGIWNMVNVVSATIDNYSGSEQTPTATVVYVFGDRLVTAVVDLSNGDITRSGATIATNGNRVLSGDNILANSITSENIDWATLTNQSWTDIFANLQVASISFKLPYNSSASSKLYRVGPFVFANIDASFTFSNPAGGLADETIPSGYRPRWSAVTLIKSPISNDTPGMSLTFGADGNISYWSAGSVNNTRFYGFCAWLTSDPWPSN